MSDALPNAVDFEKVAEIDKLLAGSDAGNIEYDKGGNPIFSEESAQKAFDEAVSQEREAQGMVDENQPEQEPAQETADTEAKGDDKPEKDEKEPEAKKTVDYDDEIEIPLPDGRKAMKLGELKDEMISLTRNRETVETQSQELATERLIVNSILSEGGEVTKERVEQLQQINENQRQRDIATINAMFPQWSDPHQREADFVSMMKTGQGLGATEYELKSITKPWIINMLKQLADYQTRETRAKTALKKVPVSKRQPGRKKGPATPQTRSTVTAAAFDAATKETDLENVDWNTLDNALR